MAKIRKGFISNSSSSSFIIFKPAKDISKTEEEKIKEFKLVLIEEFDYDLDDEYDVETLEDEIASIKDKGIDITRFDLICKNIEHGESDDLIEVLEEFGIPYIESE